jgi:hypothetical protein
MAGTGRRVVLAVLAAALVAVVCWVLLAPRFAIPDETGRAVDVAPVVVTPVPTTSPTGPASPPPPPAPSSSPTESGGPAVVPGPEPVEVGDDNGGDRDDDTGGGSGRDHPEDD